MWTKYHAMTLIPTMIIFILIAALVGYLMRNKSDKIKRIPLQVISVLLIVLEIMKQINAAKGGQYDLYALPFHFCSLYLYLLPLHSFYRGKYAKFTDAAAFGTMASLVFFLAIMPAVVYGEGAILDFTGSFSSFHTVIFHNLVPLYFFLTVALGLYDMDTKRDLKTVGIVVLIFTNIATILAYVLEVNYQNLRVCNLAPVEEIRKALVEKGGTPMQLVYVLLIFSLTVLFSLGAYMLMKLFFDLKDKIKNKIKA